MDKVTRILKMYNQLMHGQHINKIVFSVENEITQRSFDRDVEDIRLFLSESFEANELVFSKTENAYYLEHTQESMAVLEALAFATVLLQSGVFRKDETEGLIHALYATLPKQNQTELSDKLCCSTSGYTPPAHGVALLKMLNDLSDCIRGQQFICLQLFSGESVCVAPMEVLVASPELLLCAYPKSSQQLCYYSLSEIESFTVCDERYPYNTKQQYQTKRRDNHGKSQTTP